PRSAVSALACALLAELGLAQQVIEPPDRTEYALHVYVDPIFGDDTLATQFNPSVSPSAQQLRPLDEHPELGDPKPITGYLQHAPFAFKTLTGPSGALAWAGTIPWLGVPWEHPDPGERRWVKWIVIHCLPGLYGPGTDIDPVSGLPFN